MEVPPGAAFPGSGLQHALQNGGAELSTCQLIGDRNAVLGRCAPRMHPVVIYVLQNEEGLDALVARFHIRFNMLDRPGLGLDGVLHRGGAGLVTAIRDALVKSDDEGLDFGHCQILQFIDSAGRAGALFRKT